VHIPRKPSCSVEQMAEISALALSSCVTTGIVEDEERLLRFLLLFPFGSSGTWFRGSWGGEDRLGQVS
jgi:hypothetical protein